MNIAEFNQGLFDFLGGSPTPFHAVSNMRSVLQKADFHALNEADNWCLEANTGYFVTRNDSSIIAFVLPGSAPMKHGVRMLGAHTDSPCLKLKPQPNIEANGYLQLGVEVYGGMLMSPWFDRDLSIAGRVTFRCADEKITSRLVDFEKAVAIIPSLAIHLDREVNKKRSINAQTDLPPLLLQLNDSEKADFADLLLDQLRRQWPDVEVKNILDFELSLYDTQKPAMVGLNNEFIASARLDNLLSCYIGLKSLVDSEAAYCRLLVCNDHEEVGSASACGAQGPFLSAVLSRICEFSGDNKTQMIANSMMVSADNAHGIHPNFAAKHDTNHAPLLNKGPVIKVNANQRYATNSETAAVFRRCCELAQAPVQSMVARADMGCGSTIGPITASEIGVATVDVGVPQLAMHSIRELAGTQDGYYLYQALLQYFDQERVAIS